MFCWFARVNHCCTCALRVAKNWHFQKLLKVIAMIESSGQLHEMGIDKRCTGTCIIGEG